MHISTLAVQRPIATTMLLLAVVLLGLVSLFSLEVSLLPEIRSQEVRAWIAYPDAGVPEIEEAVARPVEEALVTVRGVRSIRSRVVPGGVAVTAKLHDGVDPDLVALGVRERLDAIRWNLPEGVDRPVLLGGSGMDRPSMVLGLASDDLDRAADWAETVLRPRLEQVDGVARAEILGSPKPEIQILPDPAKMAIAGVSAEQMMAAIESANVDSPGGVIQRRGIRYAVQVDSGLTTSKEVGEVVVAENGTRVVCVADLAEVVEGVVPAEGWSRLDSDPAVGVLVYKEAGANLVEMANRVHDKIEELDALEGGFEIAIITDPSPFIEQSIRGIWQAVWVGGLLAFLVLLAFLRDVRSPIILVTALPVSVIASFACLDLLGVSLNLMSLGGIALGIGMLVDNGIICLENIHRLRTKGRSAARAAAEGAAEISLPILASTLTTCAVFLPLAWVPGPIGALFRDQAIAVTVSLLVSLATALTLLPMMASRIGSGRMEAPVLPGYTHYHRLLKGCLRRPGLFLGLTVIVLTVSATVLGQLPREVLPEMATSEVEVELRLPPGTDVTATDEAARQIESWLALRPEVERQFVTVGAAGGIDPAESRRRINRASFRVRLHPDQVDERDRFIEQLTDAFADRSNWTLEVVPSREELAAILPRDESTLACEIVGPDAERAEELATLIAERADAYLSRDLPPIRPQRSESEPRFSLNLREDVLWRQDLSESEVLREIEARTGGLEVTRLRRFDEEVPVVIRPAEEMHPASGTIVARGRTYPVRELFDIRSELAPASLLRVDQARVASILWDGSLRDVRSAKGALEEAVATVGLPDGYRLRYTGTYTEMRETLLAIFRAFALSAGLVLLVLAAQFESLRLPLIIFAAVPLSIIGVVFALLFANESLNALSGIGLVVLIGIVVNDSILKVDLLRRLQASGVGRIRAIYIASRQRYRPILMTTATTSLALLPLYFGSGAELRAPLATTVIGGLTSATLLTLLVIPVIYHKIAGRPGQTPEPAARLSASLRRPAAPLVTGLSPEAEIG